MADFVEYSLDDRSTVVFESAGADLVNLHGGAVDAVPGGPLAGKLSSIAKAIGQVSTGIRRDLAPDELSVQLGVQVAAEANVWFFAKSHAEAAITVTVTWKKEG